MARSSLVLTQDTELDSLVTLKVYGDARFPQQVINENAPIVCHPEDLWNVL
jgi:hypothetical protein